jgi:multiple sugar transport system permease protein
MNSVAGKWKKRLDYGISYIVLLVFMVFFMLPILWMLLTSFKNEWQSQVIPPVWLFKPTLENYMNVLTGHTNGSQPFPNLLFNSAIVSIVTMAVGIIVGTIAAYAIVRHQFKGKQFISNWVLSTLMFPPAVSLVPIFIVVGSLNLTDTYWTLIIPYIAFNLPLTIWMMKGFLQDIPKEIEESALVDGCSGVKMFVKIILPLILPGMLATSILTLILTWNEFLYALVLTRDMAKTAPVGITEYITMYGVQWGNMTASATIITAPIVVFAIFVRKHMVRGLTFGAVKG